jgi:hypothetical protein
MSEGPCLASVEELAAMKRQCWHPGCKRKAFIRDWKGWKWCLGCWWWQFEERSLLRLWFEFRHMRLF